MSNILLPITDLTIDLAHGCKEVIAELGQHSEALIDVEYHIDQGQPERIRKDPDDSEPGYPAEMQIYRITTAQKILFVDGFNLGISLSLPSGTDITAICKDKLDAIEAQIWKELMEVEA